MQDVINKFTINLACSNEQQAFSMRDSFQKIFYEKAVSIIEKYLDEISDDQQLIVIDKIEIKLNSLPSNGNNMDDFIQKFEKAFKHEFESALTSSARKKNIHQSETEALTTFLLTGNLPWWADTRDSNPDTWCNQIQLTSEKDNFINWLKSNYHNKTIWNRIRVQLPPFFKTFIINAIPELEQAAQELQIFIQQNSNSLPSHAYQNIKNTDLIYDFIIARGNQLLDTSNQDYQPKILFTYLKSVLSTEEIEKLPADLKQEIGNIRNPTAKQNLIAKIEKNNQNDETGITKIRTNRAGLVLLAVFFSDFFQRMNLWNKDLWLDEQAQCRAVYLLNYLASGEEFSFEYNLTLEKILCGYHPQDVLTEKIRFTPEETNGAEDLLASVIEHWKALKNTSVSGFRNTFLIREGLLSQKGGNWLLQVEKKTVDILLEQIPWGFSTIHLPWAPYLIYTEW